jgi:flagellar biogenesis protein FliO
VGARGVLRPPVAVRAPVARDAMNALAILGVVVLVVWFVVRLVDML